MRKDALKIESLGESCRDTNLVEISHRSINHGSCIGSRDSNIGIENTCSNITHIDNDTRYEEAEVYCKCNEYHLDDDRFYLRTTTANDGGNSCVEECKNKEEVGNITNDSPTIGNKGRFSIKETRN